MEKVLSFYCVLAGILIGFSEAQTPPTIPATVPVELTMKYGTETTVGSCQDLDNGALDN